MVLKVIVKRCECGKWLFNWNVLNQSITEFGKWKINWFTCPQCKTTMIKKQLKKEGSMMRYVCLLFLTLLTVGCGSAQKVHEPYTYNGALSELHRNGNAGTRPTAPVYSGDLHTPVRYKARVCSSTPIFNIYGQFVRYHVECD